MCKTSARSFGIIHRKGYSWSFKMVNIVRLSSRTIIWCKSHGQLSGTIDYDIGRTVLIAKGMTADYDGSSPLRNKSGNIFYNNWLTKNRSVKDIPDRSIGRFVHLLQTKFCHTRFIRRNSSTFNTNVILLDGIGSIYSYLIISGIAMLNTQIIIFNVNIQKRENQLFSDHFPDDAGHFVPIEFHYRIQYFNFFH